MALNRLFSVRILLTLLVGIVLFGCVKTPLAPAHKPEIGTSMNSEGDLSISLTTEVGYVYTILYEDPQDRRWKPLKGAELIKGTGKTILLRKKVNPRKPVPMLTVEHSRIVE